MKFLIGVLILISTSAQSADRVYSPESIQLYLNQLSSLLAGRPLNSAELALTVSDRQNAIRDTIRSWIQGPYMGESARIMIETQMGLSGSAGGVDWNVPGYIARHVVSHGLPYSNIITADYCVNAVDERVACDSGAPYNAGILTTRGYLVRNAGRFNLSRANGMIKQFACLTYPMNRELQPSLKKEDLISMFQYDTGGGQEFGNGTACYNCHSQFGAHAQFFVKFDQFGNYLENATGLQDPAGEPGRSPSGTFTSHMQSPVKAASSASVMFGKPVSNLREAALILAQSKQFLNCSVRNTIRFGLKMSQSDAKDIPLSTIEGLAGKIRAMAPDPTWQMMIEQIFTDPVVIESALRAGGQK